MLTEDTQMPLPFGQSCLCQLLLFFQWLAIQKYLENTVYSNRLVIATALATLYGMVWEKFIALHKLSCILSVSFFQQNLLGRTEVMIKRNPGTSQQNQTWIRNMDGKLRGLQTMNCTGMSSQKCGRILKMVTEAISCIAEFFFRMQCQYFLTVVFCVHVANYI